MYSYPHKTAYGPLEDINFFDYFNTCPRDNLEVYFHIPFCAAKCGYCNLFSVTGYKEDTFQRYLTAMKQQIRQYGISSLTPPRLTIGGGTPLLLPEHQLDQLLTLLPDISKSLTCIETSPRETTRGKLDILKTYGINRVSLGVQSFLDRELLSLKRHHRADSIRQALNLLKSVGFPRLNLDLIYGIPGQTLATFQASLEEGLAYEPEEFFIYPLYIREGTSLAHDATSSATPPDNTDFSSAARSLPPGAFPNRDTLTYSMYWLARDILTDAGYTQLSMRHFVTNPPLPVSSCGFDPMLAIGCGGRSYLGDLHCSQPYATDRAACTDIVESYIRMPDKARITHGYLLNEDEHKRRYTIKNLLHTSGISLAEYHQHFRSYIYDDFPILHEWAQLGYLDSTNTATNQITLTPLGLSLSDYLGPQLVSPAVRQRTRHYQEARV
jgi:oxygen-independent coproporphyrinogen-3 oxidase